MSPAALLALAAAVTGGIALALQAPINARLSPGTGDPIAAAAISFVVGLVLLTLATVLRGAVPSASNLAALPWWAWIGGIFGMVYVVVSIFAVQVLGAVTMIAALILGQMGAALLIDAIGAFGIEAREITPQRIIGVLLVAVGIVLSRF